MLLPLGDSPNLPQTPWVTWALIAINVAVYLVLLPAGFRPPDPANPELRAYVQALMEERGALPEQLRISQGDLIRFEHGIKPSRFSLTDALTSMFLHGGFMHLFGNMLFLWIFGDNVEHRLGRLGFLLAYLGTGFAAALGDTALRWGSQIPSVGASGAISGVLGLYFLWFPRNRVRTWLFLFPFFMNVVELPARIVLGFYLVVDNLLPLLLGGEGGVAHGAHIGGFVAGWLLAAALGEVGKSRARRPTARPPTETRPPHTGGLGPAFQAALDEDRLEDATRLLLESPRAIGRTEIAAEDKLRLGAALGERGEERPALAIFQRALADHPRGPRRAAAHLGAARALLRVGSPTAAYQHLYAALEEHPTSTEAETARNLLDELRRATRHVPGRLPS